MSFSEFLKGQTFVLIQWLYAIWQIARDTTFVNSVYYLCQMAINGQLNFVFRRNTNVVYDKYNVPFTVMNRNTPPEVIHISKKYRLGKKYLPSAERLSWEDFKRQYFDNANNRNINGVELIAFNQWWYTVKFNGSYYFCHQNILFQWAMYDIDKLILLKDVELIGNELVMGTVISKEEMFEAMLSMEYHINELYAPCIFGKQYNITWNLRLSAFLATIPLLLQARGLANESALCTLILILVDLVRTPLLQLYELFMFYLTKAVKLWIFGKCKKLYIFFSWFSKRWAACDRRYGYAYYTTPENERNVSPVTTFVKFKDLGDCQFAAVIRRDVPCIESFGFQINNGVIHSAELSYGDHCLYIKVKEGFFVSSIEALTMMKFINQYSKFEPHVEVLAILSNSRCVMQKIIMWVLVKMLEIQIVKTRVATLRKILHQKQQESVVDNLLQIASNRNWTQELHDWRKKLRGTQLASTNVPKAAHAPPPAPVQRGGGSMLGSIGSKIAEGMAFGTGSAIAHRAVDAFLGPRTVQHEVVQAEAPAASQTSVPVMPNMSGKDSSVNHSRAFQECITNYGSDIGKCQFYLDMLNECRRGSETVAL